MSSSPWSNPETAKKCCSFRGSALLSRLARYYFEDERFVAFGFLAVACMPPDPDFDLHRTNTITKEVLGYELLGYHLFFAEEEAGQMINDHVSTSSLLSTGTG